MNDFIGFVSFLTGVFCVAGGVVVATERLSTRDPYPALCGGLLAVGLYQLLVAKEMSGRDK